MLSSGLDKSTGQPVAACTARPTIRSNSGEGVANRLSARLALTHHIPRQHEIRVGLVLRPPDATAELVEVSEAEAVGAIDDDCVRVRNVDAAFDDGGGDKDVRFAVDEFGHDLLQFIALHLAVADQDPGLWDESANALGDIVNIDDAIMEKVGLTAAI